MELLPLKLSHSLFQSYEESFLAGLLLTLAIEVPLAWFLVRRVLKHSAVSTSTIVFASLLASSLTLPYLWFVIERMLDPAYSTYVGELLVVLVEALVYYQLTSLWWREALGLSLIVNAVSWAAGMFIL
jgi:hypothetical protein